LAVFVAIAVDSLLTLFFFLLLHSNSYTGAILQQAASAITTIPQAGTEIPGGQFEGEWTRPFFSPLDQDHSACVWFPTPSPLSLF